MVCLGHSKEQGGSISQESLKSQVLDYVSVSYLQNVTHQQGHLRSDSSSDPSRVSASQGAAGG